MSGRKPRRRRRATQQPDSGGSSRLSRVYGLTVPKGFTLNPNSMEMDPALLQSDLEKQGVKVPSNYAALYAVFANA